MQCSVMIESALLFPSACKCTLLYMRTDKTVNLTECVSDCVFVCVYSLNPRPSLSLLLHNRFGQCRELGREKTWKIYTTILSIENVMCMRSMLDLIPPIFTNFPTPIHTGLAKCCVWFLCIYLNMLTLSLRNRSVVVWHSHTSAKCSIAHPWNCTKCPCNSTNICICRM